ncbi:MAG TPA: zinc ribbon domain-containing protein [Blastocatellia bacterium]|nr:zinc ribbon domain-containing protein [Blastocatellia bacterium]
MSVESPFCGNCGGRLRPDAKFCHRCGVDFKLFKSSPQAASGKLNRDTTEYTAITEERICALSDKNLQAALERDLDPNAVGPSPAASIAAHGIPASRALNQPPANRLPLRAVTLIIILVSVAILGVIGVAAWNHRAFFGRKLNSSVPPKATPMADGAYFQTYDVTLTSKTQFPDRATGSPDGRFAIVQPGGKLTLRVMDPFTDVQGADIQVIRQAENRARYRVSCWNMDKNHWQRLDPINAGGEFDIGRAQISKSNQVQIENISSEPLLIDAVRINR